MISIASNMSNCRSLSLYKQLGVITNGGKIGVYVEIYSGNPVKNKIQSLHIVGSLEKLNATFDFLLGHLYRAIEIV